MIVETNLGSVRGVEKKSAVSEHKYYTFLGIPYAKPPVGELRFAPPVAAEKWQGVYDATKDANMCLQAETIHSLKLRGSEDCLYLNIYTPRVDPLALRPVMFYIHGGGFLQGTGNSLVREADYLIDHDVVVVTVNYRLHILGFLNLNIPECSGNVGLKDQLMALRWVKQNIQRFGGDPNNITIFGTSAGGTSVQCFMLSPQSKGLFQKAIMQSGCITSPCSILRDHMKLAFRVARKVGYQGDDPRCILHRLRSMPSEDLLKLVFSILKDLIMEYPMSGFPPFFQPSVEIFKDDAFLPDDPENLLHSAEPIPCIVGYNEIESSIMYTIIPEFIREDPLKAFPDVIRNNFIVPDSELSTISQNIKSHYFGINDDADMKLQNLMRLISHIFVLRFHQTYRYLESSDIPPFVYHLVHYDKDDISSTGIRRRLKGAFHSDEENYLFVQKYPPVPLKVNGIEKKVRQNICSLWTNFAKTGNPTKSTEGPTWNPSTIDAPYYMEIGEDLKITNGKPDEKELNVLKELLRGSERLIF